MAAALTPLARGAAGAALRTRVVAPQAIAAAVAAPAPSAPSRGMAESLFDLRTRIAATGNVAKLTGVMKLVAASKLRGCEIRLQEGRPFGQSLLNSVAEKPAEETEGDEADAGAGPESVHHLIVPLTTDRGLCGSVNSNLTRSLGPTVRAMEKEGHKIDLFVLGEKGKSQLGRMVPENFVSAVFGGFDKEPTFGLASAIAEKIVSRDFDVITFWFNEFENAARFNVVTKRVPKLAGLPVGQRPEMFADYTVEPEDNEETLANMMEYGVAGSLYYMMLENQCSEMASRMTAMDSATNNANEMVDSLTLFYNRARQAKITTELTEIIGGAEVLQSGDDDD